MYSYSLRSTLITSVMNSVLTAPVWSGRIGAASTLQPAVVGDQERVDLVGVERATGGGEVVDRPLRPQPKRQRDVAELQVEIDQHHAAAAREQRQREVAGDHRLADPALGPEDADHRRERCVLLAGRDLAHDRLVQRERDVVRGRI